MRAISISCLRRETKYLCARNTDRERARQRIQSAQGHQIRRLLGEQTETK